MSLKHRQDVSVEAESLGPLLSSLASLSLGHRKVLEPVSKCQECPVLSPASSMHEFQLVILSC